MKLERPCPKLERYVTFDKSVLFHDTGNNGKQCLFYSTTIYWKLTSARDFVRVNDWFSIETSNPPFIPLGDQFRNKNYLLSILRSETISKPNFIQIGSAILPWRGNKQTDTVTFAFIIVCIHQHTTILQFTW